MNVTQPSIANHGAGSHTADLMWAGVYRGVGRVQLESVPVPTIAEDEVLVHVEACGICGTDVKKIYKGYLNPPQILGHEIAGTIVAVGGAVRRWRPSTRVVCFHHVPCRHCFFCERRLFAQCPQYKKVGVTAGFQPNGGGFSEYVRVMNWVVENGVIEIPSHVDFEEAVFVEPVNTCWKAIRKARVEAGEAVVVLGQGPIGLLLMMLARHVGAHAFTTDPLASRRQISVELGAEASCDTADAGLSELLKSRTQGRGADAVLVAAPHESLLQQALELTRPGGRVLLFAYNDPLIRVEFSGACVGLEEKEILGSYSSSWDLQEEAASFVFGRSLPVRRLITHRFPLAEIGQAVALAAYPSADSLKVVLNSR